MSTAAEHVQLLRSWLGTVEQPRGSNRVFICEEFGPVGSMQYYAWCMATQCVAAQRLGTPYFKTASVGFGIDAAKKGTAGYTWIPTDGKIQVGDWVTYAYGAWTDWGRYHVACVTNPGTQARFQTIGGNEQDSVRESWPDRSRVLGFIRPAYADVEIPSLVPPPQFVPVAVPSKGVYDMQVITYPGGPQFSHTVTNETRNMGGAKKLINPADVPAIQKLCDLNQIPKDPVTGLYQVIVKDRATVDSIPGQ